MHCVQRRRRERLRRRVISGELNLEQLGVKRLTVPRRILEEMPLYTFPLEKEEIPTPKNPGVQHIPETQLFEPEQPTTTGSTDPTVQPSIQHLKILNDTG